MKLVESGDELKTLADKEAEAIAYATPAHMLFLMFEQCIAKGWTLRADVLHKLNMSAGAPLAGFDALSISRLAKVIDTHATALLHDLNPDDPVDGLHSVAMFVLILIDEGLLKDARAIVVIVALMLMEDVKDNEEWPFKEKFLRQQGKKILFKANRRGLYRNRVIDVLFEG